MVDIFQSSNNIMQTLLPHILLACDTYVCTRTELSSVPIIENNIDRACYRIKIAIKQLLCDMKKLAIGCLSRKRFIPVDIFRSYLYTKGTVCVMCLCCVCMYVKNKAYFASYIRIHTANCINTRFVETANFNPHIIIK